MKGVTLAISPQVWRRHAHRPYRSLRPHCRKRSGHRRDFYSRVLGMSVVSFGQGRKALVFGRQKINLHQIGKEFEPKAKVPVAVCRFFAWSRHVARPGAAGAILSIYLRAPDQDLVEVSN